MNDFSLCQGFPINQVMQIVFKASTIEKAGLQTLQSILLNLAYSD